MEEKTYITGTAHVGVAVPDIDEARNLYTQLGYTAQGTVVAATSHGVNTLMMKNGAMIVELLSPLKQGEPSPIDTYIASKPYKMYHVAYYVSDLEAQVALMQKNRYIMIGESSCSEANQGKRTVFLFHRKLGVVELVEE